MTSTCVKKTLASACHGYSPRHLAPYPCPPPVVFVVFAVFVVAVVVVVVVVFVVVVVVVVAVVDVVGVEYSFLENNYC